MTEIVVKMVDGSQYTIIETQEVAEMYQSIWELSGMPNLLPVEQKAETVLLSGKYIVSITMKENGNDGETILEQSQTDRQRD